MDGEGDCTITLLLLLLPVQTSALSDFELRKRYPILQEDDATVQHVCILLLLLLASQRHIMDGWMDGLIGRSLFIIAACLSHGQVAGELASRR